MEENLTKPSLKQEVELLLRLQDCDVKLRQLVADKADHPRQLAELKVAFKNAGKECEHAREELKQLQASIKKMELEVESNKAHIGKFSTQMFQVKTNQEYQALDKEIQNLKQKNTQGEDQILEMLMTVDETNKKIVSKQVELVAEEKRLKEQEELVGQRLKNIEVEMAQLQEQRRVLVSQANEEALAMYERVFRNKPDVAVVKLENYTCLGCHMSLTHQIVADVKRGVELVQCENCSRILYLAE